MSTEGEAPAVVVIGGPNGAGKTTFSRDIVADTLGLTEFVNADFIAKGLSGFEPERAAIQAGRIMLTRLKELAAARASFAFETTMASRTFAPWIAGLIQGGYRFRIVFVWLRNPDLAIRRVRARVRDGGHFVPPEIIRRRYQRGAANFVRLYMPLAARWRVYDNSEPTGPTVVAFGEEGAAPSVVARPAWNRILRVADEEADQDNR